MRETKRGTIEDPRTDAAWSRPKRNHSVTVGNMTAEQAIDLLATFGVQSAKAVDTVGLWNGERENSVEITLYDATDAYAAEIVAQVGQSMPGEQAIGLNGSAVTNPYHTSIV